MVIVFSTKCFLFVYVNIDLLKLNTNKLLVFCTNSIISDCLNILYIGNRQFAIYSIGVIENSSVP